MQVIGHRGAASLAPENTWEAFDVALLAGVDAIETDIRATSDGELILIHDKRLDRTTNSKGLVELTPWSVISELDAGSWFSQEYSGAKIPLLRDTLARYGTSTHLVLEIKQPGIELRVLEMVQEFNLVDAVTFTSFDFPVVQNIKSRLSVAKVGFLTSDTSEENVMQAVKAGMNQICIPANAVSQDLVFRWKKFGLEVRAWKVKDTEVMMSALKAGVDGMTVNFPHLLLAELGRQAKFGVPNS